jgi:hypothetical protein
MEVDGHLKLMALEISCQRLAQHAKLLARAGIIVDFARLAEVDRMVSRSIEALEQEISRDGPSDKPPKKKMGAGSLLRMLRGGDDSESKSVRNERSLDTPPSPEHVLSLRGLGDGWPTPDLLGFLSSQKKTGVLEVATSAEVFMVEFEGGYIVHAHVSRTLPEQRLGDILVAAGAIDRKTLEEVRDARPKERLGEVLLRGNHVTHEQLLKALQTQIQLLFNRLFVSHAARFSFWGGPPIHADGGMRLNAMALILEGARAFDEGNSVDTKRVLLEDSGPGLSPALPS